MYDTVEYANSRLSGTVVKLKSGLPVYVASCVEQEPGVIKILCSTRFDGPRRQVSLNNVDFEPVSLGFLNKEGYGVVYLARCPKRRDWKQGVRPEAIFRAADADITISDILEVAKAKYPSIHEAFTTACLGTPCAFHRKWAFVYTNNRVELKYMFDHVGSVSEEMEVTFFPEYEYLFSRYLEDKNEALAKIGKEAN